MFRVVLVNGVHIKLDFVYIILKLLGRVALVAQRPIVVKLSRGRSVGLCVGWSVHRSVCPVHCGKRRIGS